MLDIKLNTDNEIVIPIRDFIQTDTVSKISSSSTVACGKYVYKVSVSIDKIIIKSKLNDVAKKK